MKISESLNEIICLQCKHELLNMIKYKTIASYFENLRLKNLAKKFYKQSDEEYGHYSQMVEYLNIRLGGKYKPVELDIPEINLNSITEAAELYLSTEIETTKSLQGIAEFIYSENLYLDVDFIQKFLTIQIAEEDEADEFMKKSSLVKDLVLFDATFEV